MSTLTTLEPNPVIPFGKYKGLPLGALLADPSYMEWLCAQPWFRANFAVLHQTIINRGAEPEDTPDHNAMQVKFLDDAYCLAFVRCLPKLMQRVMRELAAECRDEIKGKRYEIESLQKELSLSPEKREREAEWADYKRSDEFLKEIAKIDREDADHRAEIEALQIRIDALQKPIENFDICIKRREFEVEGLDILLRLTFEASG